jgi:hypothetical protein
MNHIIGLDIGGANLKAAHSDGPCRSHAFPIWRTPDRLADELIGLIRDWLPCRAVTLTMTAELADCFATKAEGVSRILDAVEQVAADSPVAVWQTVGEFVTPQIAREFPLLTAAANWHALATFAGRLVSDGRALLLDVGTTTTDIIPLQNGLPNPAGRTDAERLISGELVYSGSRRTPLSAVAYSVPLGETYTQVAAELFATTLDVYLLMGDIAEEPDNCDTANGRPATIEAAHDRLARLLCRDRTELSLDQARGVAEFLADVQRQRIGGAVDRVVAADSGTPETIIVSGSGNFLANRILDAHTKLSSIPRTNLTEMFGPKASDAACAFATARLGIETL